MASSDLGVGVGAVAAALVHHPGGELHRALLQQRRGAAQHRRPAGGGRGRPAAGGRARRRCGVGGGRLAGEGGVPHRLSRRMRRAVHRHAAVRRHALAADAQLEALAPARTGGGERVVEVAAESGVEPSRGGRALEGAGVAVRHRPQRRALRRAAQQVVGGGAAAALEQEAGLRGVLQHAAHQVRHAGQQLAHRHVVAGHPAHRGERAAGAFGGAVQRLMLDGAGAAARPPPPAPRRRRGRGRCASRPRAAGAGGRRSAWRRGARTARRWRPSPSGPARPSGARPR